MRLQLTAVYETGDRVIGRVAEMPTIRAEGGNLEEVRARLADKIRRTLGQARQRTLARARPSARVECIGVELADDAKAGKRDNGMTDQAGVRRRRPAGSKKQKRSRAKPGRWSKAELAIWQALLETGRIDEIPTPPARGARWEEHEPIVIQGRPISEEIIEDRR